MPSGGSVTSHGRALTVSRLSNQCTGTAIATPFDRLPPPKTTRELLDVCRQRRPNVFDLVHWTREKILRDDDQVGQLPRFDRSFDLFLERKISAVQGPHTQRFEACHALLGMQRPAVRRLARDGHPHSEEWIVRIYCLSRIEADHVVRAASHYDAGVEHGAKGQELSRARGAEYVLQRGTVKVMPRGLAIEYHSQLLGPRDGVLVGEIPVRHRKPAIPKGVFPRLLATVVTDPGAWVGSIR